MSCERVDGAVRVTTEKVQLLSSIFERLWRLDEGRRFARLVEGIDDAVIQHRCRSRVARLHRILERNYAG
jgi:hypothetical protein